MDISEIRCEAEKLWNEGNNEKLFNFLYENRVAIIEGDTDLGYTYFLSAIDRDNMDNYGRHGILYSGDNLHDSLTNVSTIKKVIQRIEWCEETDPSMIIQYMQQYGATASDVSWLIKASCLKPEYVLGRINGKNKPQDLPKLDALYLDQNADYSGVQIAFVICSNDEIELSEARYYIDRLYIPEGCNVSVLAIYEAESICAGYNEAIDSSNAEYKVYMHQDVRILDRYFIYYLLNIFTSDPQIGMIGMIGTQGMPSDGVMWNDKRYGAWIEGHVNQCVLLSRYPSKGTTEVKMADGFLLATKKDIRWRSDLFNGWDFYDASQCMEFLKEGYKVVVPYQETPWCLHDCGYINLDRHDDYREIFLKNYSEFIKSL